MGMRSAFGKSKAKGRELRGTPVGADPEVGAHAPVPEPPPLAELPLAATTLMDISSGPKCSTVLRTVSPVQDRVHGSMLLLQETPSHTISCRCTAITRHAVPQCSN